MWRYYVPLFDNDNEMRLSGTIVRVGNTPVVISNFVDDGARMNFVILGDPSGSPLHVATDDPRIIRTYGCFCTYAYIINKNSLEKIIKLLDENVHLSMGIDWLFILLQPRLKTFAFVPGMVKQMDNQSDIGDGITVFSGFSKLNGTEENSRYWWQNKMEDFNPDVKW